MVAYLEENPSFLLMYDKYSPERQPALYSLKKKKKKNTAFWRTSKKFSAKLY